MLRLFYILFFFGTFFIAHAQMWNGIDTLYGNEWIDYEKNYFKIKIAEDGIYRINKSTLRGVGVPVDLLTGQQYQLIHFGKPVPIFVSNNGIFNDADFIEFYGEQNRSQLDQHLYKDPDNEILNPLYSLVNDTSAYFLTWVEPEQLTSRYQSLENNLNNPPAKENWYWHKEVISYTEKLVKDANSQGVIKSHFVAGEGYSKGLEKSNTLDVQTDHAYLQTSDSARLQVRMALNERSHALSVKVNGQERIRENFFGHALRKYDFGVQLSRESEKISLETTGTAGSNDRQAIGTVVLNYPRTFHFRNNNAFHFELSASSSNQYLEIEQFSSGNQAPILYDISNRLRITTTRDNQLVKVSLPASNTTRELWLVARSGIKAVSQIEPVQFINYDDQEAAYVLLSNPALFDDGSGRNLVEEYAAYRQSTDGGAYSTVIVDINQLYDQFAYGVDRHYISIRNFGHYISKNWSSPEYFFIVGKGIETDKMRTADKVAEYKDHLFYVPTFGNPGADNLLLSDNYTSAPVIPLGRIAASTPTEIEIYLDKVKAFEANKNLPQTIEEKYWMKKILHLGGGDPAIQGTIRRNLEYLEEIIESSTFGGDVTAFYKESTDAIEVSRAEQLFELINDGLSIITFYGHSGVNSFDFSLDKPENYENFNKYPIFLSLGCFSGQIHNDFKGVSEDFIFAKDRGTIGFLASTGQGYVSALRLAGTEFYTSLGMDNYGEGLGNIIRMMLQALDNKSSLGIEELAAQFTLHGDPAVILNAQQGSDYIIDAKSVSFDPAVIDIQSDSFNLNFDLINLGTLNSEDTLISVLVEQKLPNGNQVTLFDGKVDNFKSNSLVSLRLPTIGTTSTGLNTIFITVDHLNLIDELPAGTAENNNELVLPTGEKGIPIFLVDNSVRPLYPINHGINFENEVILYASTTNAFAPEQIYVLEIDTTALFNSPLKTQNRIAQYGGVVMWRPFIDFINEQVYYWRISPDSIDDKIGYLWKDASFVYLPNTSYGWNQSHHYQWLENDFSSLTVKDNGAFEFAQNIISLKLRSSPQDPTGFTRNEVNGGTWKSLSPWDIGPVLNIFAWTKQGVFKNKSKRDFNSKSWSNNTFPFNTTDQESRKGIKELLTAIPDSSIVVVQMILADGANDFGIRNWALDSLSMGYNLFSLLESYGANQVRTLAQSGPVPYIFTFKKGKGILFEAITNSPEDILIHTEEVFEFFKEGKMRSVDIDLVREWESLVWKERTGETDSSLVKIWPANDQKPYYNLNGTYEQPLSEFNEAQIKHINLDYEVFDAASFTPGQLEYWRVFYKGYPDAALIFASDQQLLKDTINRGQLANLKYAVQNVSPYPIDSLLVVASVKSSQNDIISVKEKTKPLQPFETTSIDLNLTTENLFGTQEVSVQVNPDRAPTEVYYFNNFGTYSFYVKDDRTPPLLDVTFDGVHIMDGEIVSAKPEIIVRLIDENPNLKLDNIELFELSLKKPDGRIDKIPYDDPALTFIASQSNNKNEASLIYRPTLTDGLYTLVVDAKDQTGNFSSNKAYQVDFNIISKSMISNMLNYPNPFSTSTQFIFTLTGEKVPDNLAIQIYSASGIIIKTIQKEELGPLRVGLNRTTYSWDGTDEYGDILANGVYFYRIITNDDVKEFEHFEMEVDRFFKNGFGKLVILR